MTAESITRVQLGYGGPNRFCWEAAPEQLEYVHTAPPPITDVRAAVDEALRQPLDYPPLDQAVVSGDRVALVADPQTPALEVILAALWEVLSARGIRPQDVSIVLPQQRAQTSAKKRRLRLPPSLRRRVDYCEFQAAEHSDESSDVSYLASTLGGERIYLSRRIIDADVVVPIGMTRFDALLGYTGGCSVLYPWASTKDATARMRGQGHPELEPDDPRPLRELVDEIGWLLGLQFSIEVVPSRDRGVAAVLAGAPDAVQRVARTAVREGRLVSLTDRAQTVLIAVDGTGSEQTWNDLAAALGAARRLVEPEGRIVVLSSLAGELTPGLKMLSAATEPAEVLRPLRLESPPDLAAASQIADAVAWARVFLLSRLAEDVVDDLFMIPLAAEDEARRLLDHSNAVAVIESGQFVFGRVAD